MIDHETDLTTPIKRRATSRRNLYEEICSPDDLAEPNVPQIDSGIVCQVQSALA